MVSSGNSLTCHNRDVTNRQLRIMVKAVINKVAMGEVDKQFGYRRYTVHYTNNTCLVFDTQTQTHKYPEQYIRVDAVDEMDAAVKGMAKLRSLYGANNVSFGSNEDKFGGKDEDAQEQATKE